MLALHRHPCPTLPGLPPDASSSGVTCSGTSFFAVCYFESIPTLWLTRIRPLRNPRRGPAHQHPRGRRRPAWLLAHRGALHHALLRLQLFLLFQAPAERQSKGGANFMGRTIGRNKHVFDSVGLCATPPSQCFANRWSNLNRAFRQNDAA